MAINDGYEDRQEFIPVATPIDGPVEFYKRPITPLPLERISRGRVALHLLFLTIAFVLFQYVAIMVFFGANTETQKFEDFPASAALIISVATGWFVAVLGILLTIGAGGATASIGLSLKRWPLECAVGLLVGVFSLFVAYAINIAIFVFWSAGKDQMIENQKRISEFLPPMSFGWLLLTVVFAVTWEEIIFRGILLTHLRRIVGKVGWAIPILLSSLIFGLLHIGGQVPVAAISLFVVAVIWSVATVWRGSIVASTVAHLVFNMTQLYLMEFAKQHMPPA